LEVAVSLLRSLLQCEYCVGLRYGFLVFHRLVHNRVSLLFFWMLYPACLVVRCCRDSSLYLNMCFINLTLLLRLCCAMIDMLAPFFTSL